MTSPRPRLGASQRHSGLGPRLSRPDHDAETGRPFEEVPRSVAALHAIVDLVDRVHSQRVRSLVTLLLLNLGDVASTMWLLARGGREANPLVSPIVDRWWLLLLLKLIVLGVMARGVLTAPARSGTARGLVAVAGCYYLAVLASNLRVIARL